MQLAEIGELLLRHAAFGTHLPQGLTD